MIIEANVGFNEFDVEGFLNVEGYPELSYTEPRFSYGYAGFKISRRRVAGQGIYAAGAALEVNAVSKSWLLRSFVLPSSKLACEGTNIAHVSDPRSTKMVSPVIELSAAKLPLRQASASGFCFPG